MDAPGRWIDEVEFPATKADVIEAAADAGCPQDLLEALQALGQEHYDSRDELEAELAAD
jgi:hypothetical protein